MINHSTMHQNQSEQQNLKRAFDPGGQVFGWTAYDYHPHQRGVIWYSVFCLVLFGGAVWSMISDPQWGWLMALSFFLAAAVYFYAHRTGDQPHQVIGYERGLFIDNKFIPFENIAGFWVLYDETVSIINFQLKSKYRNVKISLQMGEESPEFFRENMKRVNLDELEDAKESLIDLWIRALKL